MAELPAGMRNNNPGNIKYVGQPGTTPSVNTDQGDPQAVYASPQAGMNAMYRLLKLKYSGGRRTVRQIIADNGGWTPGNIQAAENIARTAGIGLDDDIGLDDPAKAQRFMRGLLLQEHGQASSAYDDGMLATAITGGGGGAPQGGGGGQFSWRLEGGAKRPDSVTGMDQAFRAALMNLYANAPPEVQKELALTSGFRSHQRQQELFDASDKSGKMVAKPGTSKHESGTAADLYGFGLKGGGNAVSQATKDYVMKNAGTYNLAFPMDYEPWHIQLASSPSGGGGTGTAMAVAPGAAAASGAAPADAGRSDLTDIIAGLKKDDDNKPRNWMQDFGQRLQKSAEAPLPQAQRSRAVTPAAALAPPQDVAPLVQQDPNRRAMLAQVIARLNSGKLSI